ISLLQSIVSLPVLAKSPLPSRLWNQLCDDLEQLWSVVQALVSRQQQQQPPDLLKAQLTWVKAMYLPGLDASLSSSSCGGVRLTNAKLPPVLVLWIVRHGPSCQDIGILRRLQTFCETGLDIKSGKMILAKIEALLKKKTQ
ncbi:hypothetical protein BGZ73_000859, partial [Actinomortierella ambigua]